jgi:hypothetical protein
VRLRVLVDHSALEAFANGVPFAARVYPTRSDANSHRHHARRRPRFPESMASHIRPLTSARPRASAFPTQPISEWTPRRPGDRRAQNTMTGFTVTLWCMSSAARAISSSV